jgi:hypothetical protein
MAFKEIHPRLEESTPHTVPQYYGGLGLPRDVKDKVPAIDHAAVLTVSRMTGEKRNAMLKVIQPRTISTPFMSSVVGELGELKKSLEIEDEYIPAEDIGLLRFGDRPDSFWEQEILNGFATASSLTLSPDDVAEAVPNHNTSGWFSIVAQHSPCTWRRSIKDVSTMKGVEVILRENGKMGLSGEVAPEKIWENGLRLKRVSPMPRLE